MSSLSSTAKKADQELELSPRRVGSLPAGGRKVRFPAAAR
jgi:hypothetical protein